MSTVPKRILQHEIDSEACKTVAFLFNRSWELRDLTGRDFGIDKIAEKFQDNLATGELLLLQIKGTEQAIDNNNVKFSLDTKTLLYSELFSVPFLLLYCSISEPKICYYLWLQEYIRVRLNYDNPKWKSQVTNTVYFPSSNILGNVKSEEHLCYISKFAKYQESWVNYYIILEDLRFLVPSTYCVEDEPLFNDKVALDRLCHEIIKKLNAAVEKLQYIPNRFIPECFFPTIKICDSILSSPTLPQHSMIHKLLQNCVVIEGSVVGISQRFNSKYLRAMFEFDGTADY